MHSDYQVLKEEMELIKWQMKELEERVNSSLASSMNVQVCHNVNKMCMNNFRTVIQLTKIAHPNRCARLYRLFQLIFQIFCSQTK